MTGIEKETLRGEMTKGRRNICPTEDSFAASFIAIGLQEKCQMKTPKINLIAFGHILTLLVKEHGSLDKTFCLKSFYSDKKFLNPYLNIFYQNL